MQIHATAACGAASAEPCTVHCSWNFACPIQQDMFTISGTAGVLQLSCFGTEPVRLTLMDAAGGIKCSTFTFDKLDHVQQPLIQLITNELTGTGNGVSPSKGDNAIRVASVMDVALERYYGGRADEFWKRGVLE